MLKKLIYSFLLTCIMSGGQIWAGNFKVGEAKYKEIGDGTLEIQDYRTATGDLVIPASVYNPKKKTEQPVASIAPDAFSGSAITSVTIPGTVNCIGDRAFMNCEKLNTVRFEPSDSKLEIYVDAFSECPITSLEICRDFSPYVSKVAGIFGKFNDNKIKLSEIILDINDENFNYLKLFGRNGLSSSYLTSFTNKKWPKSAKDLKSAISYPEDMYISVPKSSDFTDIEEMTIAEASNWSGKEKTDDSIWLKWGDLKEAIKAAKKIEKFRKDIENANSNDINLLAGMQGLNTRFKTVESLVVDSLTNSLLNKKELTVNEIAALGTPLSQTYLFHLGSDYGIDNLFIDVLITEDIIHKDLAAGKHADQYEMLIDIQRKVINTLPKPLEAANIADSYACIMTAFCGLGRWNEAAKFYQTAHRAYTKSEGKCPEWFLTLRDMIKAEGVKISDPVYAKTGKTSKNGFTTDDARTIMEAALGEYKDYRDRKKREEHSAEYYMKKLHFKEIKR